MQEYYPPVVVTHTIPMDGHQLEIAVFQPESYDFLRYARCSGNLGTLAERVL